jgi:hypothetical protein
MLQPVPEDDFLPEMADRDPDYAGQDSGGWYEEDRERQRGVRTAGWLAIAVWMPVVFILSIAYFTTGSIDGLGWLLVVGALLMALFFLVGYLRDAARSRGQRRHRDD